MHKGAALGKGHLGELEGAGDAIGAAMMAIERQRSRMGRSALEPAVCHAPDGHEARDEKAPPQKARCIGAGREPLHQRAREQRVHERHWQQAHEATQGSIETLTASRRASRFGQSQQAP
jgi:hypothetical protein